MKEIKSNIDLSALNSFGFKVLAHKFYEFTSSEQLSDMFTTYQPLSWKTLGGGNNIVITDDISELIIHPTGQRIEIESTEDNYVLVYADAGVDWDSMVEWSVSNSLWGLENLSIIPGTVGASPVQNIGAYGVEVKDCIESVEVFLPESLQAKRIEAKDCKFGYRDSIFKGELKGRAIITGVHFRLSTLPAPQLDYAGLRDQVAKMGEPTLNNIRESVIEIRNSKLPDPKVLGNVGSFFKNPIVEKTFAENLKVNYENIPIYNIANDHSKVKIAAGWLIDKAGWKGYKDGAVGVHQSQALVLVNHGGANGKQILELANKIIEDIEAKFGIKIEREVNLW